jgi:hypothetical protein
LIVLKAVNYLLLRNFLKLFLFSGLKIKIYKYLNFFFNFFFKKLIILKRQNFKQNIFFFFDYLLKNPLFFNFNTLFFYLIFLFNFIFNVKLENSRNYKKSNFNNNALSVSYIYSHKRISTFFSFIRSFFYFEQNKNYKVFLFFLFQTLIFDFKNSIFFVKKNLCLRKFLL